MNNFPPVEPIDGLTPWGQPQSMPARPRAFEARRARQPGPGVVTIYDPHHYGLFNGSNPLNVPNGGSVLVLSEPTGLRNMLMFRNASVTANIYLDFGNPAGLFSTIRLTPNTMLLYDAVVPQDDVYAYADAAGAVLSYSFSNVSQGI